jgi:hypothetical protein
MESGKDLIFAMGAPGSRWSGTLRVIQMYHACINHSDDRPERTYDRYSRDNLSDKEESVGWHRGAYWGPAHGFGQGFDNIKANYTKETFLEECKKPFTNWNGVKIIKSHWFAYNIETLKEWFPEAKLLAIQFGSDIDTFAWWHYVGGWEIPYPHYDWYENNERMFEQIQKENKAINKHFNCKYDLEMQELNKMLNIDPTIRKVEDMWAMDTKLSEKHEDSGLERHLRVFNNVLKRCGVGVI